MTNFTFLLPVSSRDKKEKEKCFTFYTNTSFFFTEFAEVYLREMCSFRIRAQFTIHTA
jgi:hypothetical protein